MSTLEELEQRVSAIEAREAAEITDLKKRIATLERWKGDSYTALGKLLPIMEETRLRVSAVEFAVEGLRGKLAEVKDDVSQTKSDIGQVRTEQVALRRDLPGMMAETMREVLAEQRKVGGA